MTDKPAIRHIRSPCCNWEQSTRKVQGDIIMCTCCKRGFVEETECPGCHMVIPAKLTRTNR